MGEDFRRLKARRATELRRDARLTPTARLVALELLAWWSEKRPRSPIYGRTNKALAEDLGLSPSAVKRAKEQLERFTYFRFTSTGRADLAWPAPLQAEQRWLNLSHQPGQISTGREVKSGHRINQETVINQKDGSRSKELAEQWLREALGEDGPDILSALYAIEGGRPYCVLIARAQEGAVGERELDEARLIVLQSRAKAVGE